MPVRSVEEIRERAIRKYAQEMSYSPGADVYAPRDAAAECARRQRLRELLGEIDSHRHHEFTEEEVRELAWRYYETVESVKTIIEARLEELHAYELAHDGSFLSRRELAFLCRVPSRRSPEFRRFLAERFPDRGRMVRTLLPSGRLSKPWLGYTPEEVAEIVAAWKGLLERSNSPAGCVRKAMRTKVKVGKR